MPLGTPYLAAGAAHAAGATTLVATVSHAVGANDAIAVWVVSNAATNNISSVTDSKNNTYNAVGSAASNTNQNGQWFVSLASTALTTSDTITLTCSSTGGTKTLSAYGCSGVLTASATDQTPTPTSGTSTAPSITSGTLAQASELALAGEINTNTGGAITWGGSFASPTVSDSQHITNNIYGQSAAITTSSTAALTASGTITSANWAMAMITLKAAGAILLGDVAAEVEKITIAAAVPIPEVAGAVDSISHVVGYQFRDVAGAVDSLSVIKGPVVKDQAAMVDALSVIKAEVITYTPASLAAPVPGIVAVEAAPVIPFLAPAVPAFISNTMPKLHLQNLVTGQWISREVTGVTQPVINRQLNAPGTFSLTLSPPQLTSGLLDATGNPVVQVWQTAAYLEQNDKIGWGGICTSATPQGPNLPLTFTEFMGYPNGMIYDGPPVSKTNYDALDAVRAIWAYLQSQTGGNIGMKLGSDLSGALLGATIPFSAQSVLSEDAEPGDTRINIVNVSVPPSPGTPGSSVFTVGALVQVGTDPPHKITYAGTDHLLLGSGIKSYQGLGNLVGQIAPVTPYTLSPWNSTDCGQEITAIQAEAVFDMAEVHAWTSPAKLGVTHQLYFGVPRLGTRRTDLRFAEGENVITAGQVTQDGSTYGNNVIFNGAGQGKATVRAAAGIVDGRVRRTVTYTDQTVITSLRARVKALKVLTAVSNLDAVTSLVVKDHPNASIGSFGVGDDILVQLASGWRNASIWSRIISLQQDPTTNVVTLGLARSDSFTYIAASGSGGTL